MRVAIIENTEVTHHGQVGVALHEAAAVINLHKPWRGEPLPGVEADALVIFGGEQSALSDDTHPYLPDLARLMADYAARDRPVLGICLGAQVLARAFGAENILDGTPEFGWTDVTLTDAGRADPVLAGLPEAFPIFQWHSDTFTLPTGATHLARTAHVPAQGFRLGRATYGLQFHLEASRAVVEDWSRRFPAMVDRMHPGWEQARPRLAQERGVMADAIGLALARNWVGLI